jgi:hypothetical protein
MPVKFPSEKAHRTDGVNQKLTKHPIQQLAEVFLILEKWQYELESGSVERTHIKHVPPVITKTHGREENIVTAQETV